MDVHNSVASGNSYCILLPNFTKIREFNNEPNCTKFGGDVGPSKAFNKFVLVFVIGQKAHVQLLLANVLWWLCRFVVRDFVYNEKEMAEERQEYLRLVEEKKTQFVSYLS